MSHDVRPRPRLDEHDLPGADLPGAELPDPGPGREARDVSLREAFDRVNAFFYHKKTGLGLILAMAFLTLMGTLLEQAPDGAAADPQAWNSWLDSVRPRYGGWTSILAATGMFGVFGSIWFKTVTVLLAVSIIACTCHRVPQLWQRARHPHTHVSEAFFDHAGLADRFTMPQPPAEALAAVQAALGRRRYRVLIDERGPGLNLYADRSRWTPFGTALAHASFVLILAGVLVSTTFGFKNPSLPVAVGTKADVGHGTGLVVEARSFADKYADDGRPLDYYSDLVLYEDGRQVQAQTVRVNSPMRHGGVSIHQASYGIAAAVSVTDAAGARVYAGSVPLSWQSEDKRRSVGKVKLEDRDLTLYVVSAASGAVDPEIGAGQVLLEVYRGGSDKPEGTQVVSQGKPATLGDLRYTFERERQYTGLMVVKDPGAIWVWIGSGLMVIGLILTMFLHHRRLWIRLRPAADGAGTDVRIASPERQDTAYERWFRRFVADLSQPDAPREESLADYDRRARR